MNAHSLHGAPLHKYWRRYVCTHNIAIETIQAALLTRVKTHPSPGHWVTLPKGSTRSYGDTYLPFLLKLWTPSFLLEPLPPSQPRLGAAVSAAFSTWPTAILTCQCRPHRSFPAHAFCHYFSRSFLDSFTSLPTGVVIHSLHFQNVLHRSAESAVSIQSSDHGIALESFKVSPCLLGRKTQGPSHLTQTYIPAASLSVPTCALLH